MTDIFEISDFDSYREDNRREVKKAKEGLPTSLWDTYSAFANSYGGVIDVTVIRLPENHAIGYALRYWWNSQDHHL